MKLRFFARGTDKVSVPRSQRVEQAPRYVGRSFVAPSPGKPAEHPATRDAYECELDSDRGRRLVALVRREASLWPADEATAVACGVEFVKTEFRDGEHIAAVAPKAASKPAKE